jgi:hypothetical protein
MRFFRELCQLRVKTDQGEISHPLADGSGFEMTINKNHLSDESSPATSIISYESKKGRVTSDNWFTHSAKGGGCRHKFWTVEIKEGVGANEVEPVRSNQRLRRLSGVPHPWRSFQGTEVRRNRLFLSLFLLFTGLLISFQRCSWMLRIWASKRKRKQSEPLRSHGEQNFIDESSRPAKERG